MWSPISSAQYNETMGGEAQVNNLIKPSKQGQRVERNAQKAVVRMPVEEHSQMALRKSKQWCGIEPIPPSHWGIYSNAVVYPETSSLHDLNPLEMTTYKKSNNEFRNELFETRNAPVKKEYLLWDPKCWVIGPTRKSILPSNSLFLSFLRQKSTLIGLIRGKMRNAIHHNYQSSLANSVESMQ